MGSNSNLLGGNMSVLNSSIVGDTQQLERQRDKSREALFATMPQQPALQESPGQPLKDSKSTQKMQKKPSAVKIK